MQDVARPRRHHHRRPLALLAPGPEQREHAETARHSGEAPLTVIDDLLNFAKIEASTMELETIDFDLREELDNVIDLLAEPAERAGRSLTSRVAHSIPQRLRGDPGRLRQVLANAVGHAVASTPAGEVLVAVAPADDGAQPLALRFVISNAVIGIAPEAQLYGGSGPGQGATFSVVVPFLPAEAPAPAPPTDLCGVRGLIVDAAPASRNQLAHLMVGWGMLPLAVGDADAALAALRAGVQGGKPFDVVLADATTPQGGLGLAQAIGADPALAATPLIVLTARSASGQALRAAGVAGVLARPIRSRQLFAGLAVALGIRAPAPAAPPPPLLRRERVLVVEDNAVNQRVTRLLLEKLGFRADVAANGREALAATALIPYDLVLMDCHMPVLDGFAATAAIRQRDGAGRRTLIVAATANALAAERERCMAAGMDDYLAKPIAYADLVALLNRWLPAVAPEPPATPALDRTLIATVLGVSPEEDPELVRELVAIFLQHTPQALADLAASLACGALTAAAASAHSLKGSAGILGLSAFRSTCAEVEALAKAGDPAALGAAHAALLAAYADAAVALEHLCGALAGHAAPC
jgi:CheY-like chemotaxis protein/HPt (histidine-containing phosphotransfer) domain-containing protein